MYYLLMTMGNDDDASLYTRPAQMKSPMELTFSKGTSMEGASVPVIEYVRKKSEPGRLTDILIALTSKGEVFNTKVRDILDGLGVKNIEYYDTTVNDEINNQIITDYKVANIVGVFDCVDFEKSELELDEDDGSIDDIDKLILKNDVIEKHNLPIFRIKEYFPLIVVDETIKNAFEKEDVSGVVFMKPEKLRL